MYCVIGHAEELRLVLIELGRIDLVEAQEAGYQ